MKIRKGDTVIVIAGKDRGKSGTVLRAYPAKDLVLVENINTAKRHQRARRQGQRGQIISKTVPVHVSNVALKDPKSGKPTRVGYSVAGKTKDRIARKSGSKI